MAYELITERDLGAGIHTVFQYVNDVTNGLFMPFSIFLIYIVLALSMYYAQKRMGGRGDIAVCFAISSYVMAGFVILLAMIPGLVNGYIVVEIIVLATVGTLWIYFAKKSEY